MRELVHLALQLLLELCAEILLQHTQSGIHVFGVGLEIIPQGLGVFLDLDGVALKLVQLSFQLGQAVFCVPSSWGGGWIGCPKSGVDPLF